MPGKILLINTNRIKPRISPIGLDYVHSGLERAQAEVKFFDEALEARGRGARLEKMLKDFSPDLIGITVRNIDDCYFLSGQSFLGPIRRLIQWLRKKSSAKIVLGGVGYSIAPRALLDYLGADYGIWGDGEEAIVKLLRALSQGKAPQASEISGLVIPGEEDFSRAELDLSGLLLSRKLANNSLYFQLGGQIGIETKRGCDGKCIYCADPLAKGRKIRLRSAEAVAEEIEALLRQGVWAFHICDSEFNRPYFHSVRVLEEICRRNLGKKIALYAYCSPHPFDQALAELYAKAGGRGICFGADSGSEQMLSTLQRDHSVEDLEKVVKACKRAGVKVMYDLLIGGPGESKKSLRETISLMKKLKPDRVGLSYGIRVYDQTSLKKLMETKEEPDYAQGRAGNNPGLIFPVFYLSAELKKDGLSYLKELIQDDPRFFLPLARARRQNYNYSGNIFLERLIRKGARGAYWAILMENQ